MRAKAAAFSGDENAVVVFTIEPPDHRCVYARNFAEWARREVLDPLAEGADAVKVNRAKITIQDRWYSYRQAVPREHRDNLGSSRHICLYSVYLEALAHIHQISLTAAPPEYAYPEKRKAPSAWASDTIIGWDASLIDTLEQLAENDE